jgi:hypothetical protein
MRDIFEVDLEEIKKINWQGDTEQYDLALHELGAGRDEFIIINPWISNPNLRYYIYDIPKTNKCVFWYHETEWVAKYFTKDWTPGRNNYKEIEIVIPKLAWRKNPDFDRTMIFEDDPFGVFEPTPWDSRYELVWYIDPRFNPLDDKVWAISCKPIGVSTIGVKDMGYVVPQVDIEFNEALPDLDINIDECCPAYYDLQYECAWELDPIHVTENDDRLWIVKFTPRYRKPKEWKWYGVISPEYIVEYNPDVGELNYNLDLVIPWHDLGYEHIWMLDNKHLSKGEEEIWAFKIRLTDNILGSKLVDYISPDTNIEYNPDVGELNYNLDLVIPWHDLGYEHVWMLDNKHLGNSEEEIWAFKIRLTDNILGSKLVDYISPTFNVEYNPDIGELNHNLDLVIPWHDLRYEHIWMLDNKHLEKGEEEIWAFKIRLTDNILGSKLVDYISPIFKIEYNEDLPNVNYNTDYIIPWHDLQYEHIWYLADSKEKIWTVKLCAVENSKGKKDMGSVSLILPRLDVIFISYHEPNAEENWERVLEKAPWAKRVDGVEGIFNAHKTAAKLANTDMFFVVDGDAYLTYDWEFDFQPSIFDRDCVHVWKSKNPINNLTYGYGGVKLFDRLSLVKLKKWGTDLTLSAGKKLKVMDRVSNITKFNTSEFNTWKAAFRECAKLAKKADAESNERLQSWLNPTGTANFADWAKKGAEQGIVFANSQLNINNINDYKWLKQQFINNYNSI